MVMREASSPMSGGVGRPQLRDARLGEQARASHRCGAAGSGVVEAVRRRAVGERDSDGCTGS